MTKQNKHSLDFGKKEKVLNYACQTYQLSRPNKVGAVMALIHECQPKTISEKVGDKKVIKNNEAIEEIQNEIARMRNR